MVPAEMPSVSGDGEHATEASGTCQRERDRNVEETEFSAVPTRSTPGRATALCAFAREI